LRNPEPVDLLGAIGIRALSIQFYDRNLMPLQ